MMKIHFQAVCCQSVIVVFKSLCQLERQKNVMPDLSKIRLWRNPASRHLAIKQVPVFIFWTPGQARGDR